MKKGILMNISRILLIILFLLTVRYMLIVGKAMRVEESYFGDRYELMDIYKEDETYHLVYGDDTGFSFEIITVLQFITDTGMFQTIECTYIDSMVESKQEALEELNAEYSNYIVTEYIEGSGIYRLSRPETVDLEEWVSYVAEYLSEKDVILDFSVHMEGLISHSNIWNEWDYCTQIENYGDWVHSYSDSNRLSSQEINDILLYQITANSD